jgi:hypothetical protein
MYHLSPFTYLIEALLGQGMIVLSLQIFPAVQLTIFFQLSAANSSIALKKSWLPSNPPQVKVAVHTWLNILPIVVDTSRILMPSPIAVSVQAGSRTNGWDQASISFIATTGEISDFSVLIFYSM